MVKRGSVRRLTPVLARGADSNTRAVRRVAIVGPGLDVVDKQEGYDFYPPQTIQPFAVIDSLIRLGLADAGTIRVTTFDVSARVNDHILEMTRGARAGRPYTLHLPLDGATVSHGTADCALHSHPSGAVTESTDVPPEADTATVVGDTAYVHSGPCEIMKV